MLEESIFASIGSHVVVHLICQPPCMHVFPRLVGAVALSIGFLLRFVRVLVTFNVKRSEVCTALQPSFDRTSYHQFDPQMSRSSAFVQWFPNLPTHVLATVLISESSWLMHVYDLLCVNVEEFMHYSRLMRTSPFLLSVQPNEQTHHPCMFVY